MIILNARATAPSATKLPMIALGLLAIATSRPLGFLMAAVGSAALIEAGLLSAAGLQFRGGPAWA